MMIPSMIQKPKQLGQWLVRMGTACSVRGNNPLKGVIDFVDAVWRFTLSIAGRDPSPLFEDDVEVEETPSSPSRYNLRPRQPVNYRV